MAETKARELANDDDEEGKLSVLRRGRNRSRSWVMWADLDQGEQTANLASLAQYAGRIDKTFGSIDVARRTRGWFRGRGSVVADVVAGERTVGTEVSPLVRVIKGPEVAPLLPGCVTIAKICMRTEPSLYRCLARGGGWPIMRIPQRAQVARCDGRRMEEVK